MSTLHKRFEELSLHIGNGVTAGLFDGWLEAEDGVIDTIILDGLRWETGPSGAYGQSAVSVDIPESHPLRSLLIEALNEVYKDDIASTDPDADYDPKTEHGIGVFESMGRR